MIELFGELFLRPIFSNKNSSDKVIIKEAGKTISDEKELCRTFNTYFEKHSF